MHEVTDQLKRLLHGLVDQEIKKQSEFYYDGSRLYPDEVADLMLPSVVCLAQDLAERLGLESFGFSFELVGTSGPRLPLEMSAENSQAMFFEIAPFVAEIFEGDLLDCSKDLAKFFERAARVVRPDFSLDSDSNYGELTS